MLKNYYLSAAIWCFLCVLLLIFIILLFGCSLLPTSSNPIVTGPVPTATQQLWQAAKNSNWLVTVSILSIAAGVFAFLNGSKMGLPCIGASCISLFMALAVARFSTWMAVFGLIGSLAAVGISVLVKNRAVKEIVTGVQGYKTLYLQNANIDSKDLNETLAINQTKSTQKLVQNVKSKLKLKGKI